MNRARIVKALKERPYNANQLAELLGLDYKTVRHHLKVLEDNGIIVCTKIMKYGSVYMLTEEMENIFEEFREIWDRIG
ncbi:MAG: winged helix-turn-helix domain-containing protein [Candidatus Jordarchaeales archaeon]